jgi:hypothetical protein
METNVTITSGKVGIRASAVHKDKEGRVISIQRNYLPWPRYQAWRAKWCEAHRYAWTVKGFREGKISPLTLGFALILLIRR